MPATERRRLLEGASETAPLSQQAVEAAVAIAAPRHGFGGQDQSSASSEPLMRRRRGSTGRSQQFTVKLRPDTMAEIYDIANIRNIPLAQVIEEAIAKMR